MQRARAWLAIRMTDSEPYLDLKIINGEVYIKGRFYKRGILYDIRDDGTFVLGQRVFMSGNMFEASPGSTGTVGISIN